MTVGILLLIGMIPASAVTFFCCCLAGATAAESAGQRWDAPMTTGMVAGSIGGLLTLVLMLWGGIVMIRRSKQPPSA